jgi:hypothetical protein
MSEICLKEFETNQPFLRPFFLSDYGKSRETSENAVVEPELIHGSF